MRRELGEGRALLRLRVGVDRGEVGGIAGARRAQRASERAVDVMRGACLGGAWPVLVARDEPRDDGLERVGLGGGERLQRLEPRCGKRHRGLRLGRGGGGGRLCRLRDGGHDPWCGSGNRGGGAGEAYLLEQMSARDIAGRTAPVVVVGHDVLPSVFLSCSMVHPALVCRKHTLVSRMRCSASVSEAVRRCSGTVEKAVCVTVHASRVYPTCAHLSADLGYTRDRCLQRTTARLRASCCVAPGTRERLSAAYRAWLYAEFMLTRITCRSRICGNGRRARTIVTQDKHEETSCGHLP